MEAKKAREAIYELKGSLVHVFTAQNLYELLEPISHPFLFQRFQLDLVKQMKHRKILKQLWLR